MKKIMMVGSALMLLSTSAFATKARLQALGEDKDGSYYISDYRNIYINPAELNSLGNMAVLEWGTAGSSFGDASVDPDSNPKAQGGVVYGLSNGLKFGAVLGDETDVASLTRMLASNVYGGAATTTHFLQTADNVVDLFLAGSASVNWGANLLYTNSKDEVNNTKQSAYAVRLGASQDKWNAHMLLALGAKAENTNTTIATMPTYKGKFGIRVGGGYDLSSENKVFGMYENYSWTQDNATDSPERTGKFSKGIVGLGHTKKVTPASSLYAKAQIEVLNINLEGVSSLVAAKIDRVAVPLTFGFEHTSTEWLVLRGSVVQNLFGTIKNTGLAQNFGTVAGNTTGYIIRNLANQKYGSSLNGSDGKKTLPNSTTVNAGATLKFASLEVDGLIGATSSNGADESTAGAGKKGTLSVANLETRVGVTYKF